MKRLIMLAILAGLLLGCVSEIDAHQYNNIDLVKCTVSNTSPNGLWDDSEGLCSQGT